MRSASFLQVALFLFSTASTAAASPDWQPAVQTMVVRADDSADDNNNDQNADASPTTDAANTSTAASVSATATSDSNEDDNKKGDDSDSSSDDPNNTAKPDDDSNDDDKKSSGKDGSKTASKTESPKSKTFPPDAPQGGISMQTPATTALPTPLYKIGETATFVWNYTSLLGPPSAIDILVSCSTLTSTWTLTQNMTFNTNASYEWDTNKQKTDADQPLNVPALYTLVIKDSEADLTDVASPGYLGVYSGLTIGLYTPRPYVPLDEFDCVGCSAAPLNYDRHFAVMAISMALVTIFSFTWFVQGLHLQ